MDNFVEIWPNLPTKDEVRYLETETDDEEEISNEYFQKSLKSASEIS